MSRTALVTGGSGFLACQLVERLLAGSDVVHTTVRSLTNEAKLRPLRNMQQQYPGQLHIFEADLLSPGSFDEAMAGCAVVHHVASPFLLPEKIKDGRRQLLEPALHGTRNVLQTVNKTPSVARVVMTSTVGAIFGDYIDALQMKDQMLSEAYFNTTSTLENYPYHFSKVEAEKEAWRICKEQDRWRLVTINPGLILGPSLTPASDSGSLFLLDEMLKGHFFYGLPDWSMTTVDVREVVQAHINAAREAGARGRYILAEREMISLVEISRILRKVHKRPWLLPKRELPNWLVRLFGPFFGLGQDYMRKHLGIRFKVDNARSIEELGIVYRPIEQTLIDHYSSWIEQRSRRSRSDALKTQAIPA
jgi:nucleoside-diphosphate-sugar epimerase